MAALGRPGWTRGGEQGGGACRPSGSPAVSREQRPPGPGWSSAHGLPSRQGAAGTDAGPLGSERRRAVTAPAGGPVWSSKDQGAPGSRESRCESRPAGAAEPTPWGPARGDGITHHCPAPRHPFSRCQRGGQGAVSRLEPARHGPPTPGGGRSVGPGGRVRVTRPETQPHGARASGRWGASTDRRQQRVPTPVICRAASARRQEWGAVLGSAGAPLHPHLSAVFAFLRWSRWRAKKTIPSGENRVSESGGRLCPRAPSRPPRPRLPPGSPTPCPRVHAG